MIKDLHFDFVGFHGTDGYCHLRVAQKTSGSKMVVVCSQYKNYYGTSPTNAVELIAKKFFYDVVNGKIKDVSLPIEPTYERWHDDASRIDKLLVGLSPKKYKNRFKDTYLDISKIFNEIIWIERYPAGTGFWDDKDDLSLVSMGEHEDPTWHSRPTESFIKEKTGFDFSDLFADPDVIDLKEVQKNIAINDDARNIALNLLNRPVRWTQDILNVLPSKINVTKFSTGRENDESLWELQIQGLIEEIFSISFPAKDLFKSEYKVSKLLGIHKSGSEKKCDLAVFEPESNNPRVMIEIKRASKSVDYQSKKILQDIAKLLIYSKVLKSDAYLLICGSAEELEKVVSEVTEILSLDNSYENSSLKDKYKSIDEIEFSEEYSDLLSGFGIHSLHTRLVGISEDNAVCLWQVSHIKENIMNNKPYLYRLMNPSNNADDI
ncbi:hypothetical protein [Pseudoalteromonas arctica]|uniref:hypothetical protein n=1 Tax=Pseudoalteromonas arctica TaxID=394751 RepID=UPI001B7D003C|nr:hypothetical protein [Pseudoalteromonas arctica]